MNSNRHLSKLYNYENSGTITRTTMKYILKHNKQLAKHLKNIYKIDNTNELAKVLINEK